MTITIAGGHGKIAMLTHPILKANGHHVRALIRKEEQMNAVRNAGAEPIICDIEKEEDLSEAVGDSEIVVFAAGAGPGSGADRKWTVDRDGALKLMRAARVTGASRYIMISAMNLDSPRGSEVFQVYLKAKAEADEALKNSGLPNTIIKPGKLTDEPGTGKISAGKNLGSGSIPREDVAKVLAATIEDEQTVGMKFNLVSGDDSIHDALDGMKSG